METWKTFLNLRAYIWLHISASRIGSGKVTTRVYRLITSVLMIVLENI